MGTRLSSLSACNNRYTTKLFRIESDTNKCFQSDKHENSPNSSRYYVVDDPRRD